VVQDKGKQSKGAVTQLDHRTDSQDSWFPAQVTAQHFHGGRGMGVEARAALGAEERSAAGGTQTLSHVASCPGRVRSQTLASLRHS